MTFAAGTKLGTYDIVELIGSGGMGEVYRARDTKLGRDVAIKVLPEAFSKDSGRLARFEREARLLAALNHSNIAAIYDFEEHEGVYFLALELVGGETLAERISRGAVPMEEALPLFKQIAEALEAAHEKGIIHRDLKPANIKVTPDGKVKVLDFGLAKAQAGEEAPQDLSQSPTLTRQGTEMGVLLGTAPYMSPEQVRGKPVDKRADIWAFGCVVFEALTGKSAFLGETVSDTLAAVLKQEPDWLKLPPETPAAIRSLMRRCLQKNPDRRLHDVADARIEIEEALTEPVTIDTPESTTTHRGYCLWALAGLLVGSALAATLIVNLTGDRQAFLRTSRVSINLPSASGSPSVLSPEGDHLIYIREVGAREQLFRRDLDSFETEPIPGTEGSQLDGAFFSPDGREIGFFVDGKLKRISSQGGSPQTICDAPNSRGGAWGPDGTIVFSPTAVSGLVRVSASGGTPEVLTSPDSSHGERSHRWPEFLPGGKELLFSSLIGGEDQQKIEVISLETRERKLLIEGAVWSRYSPTGHLLYAQNTSLLVAPFDLDTLEVNGASIELVDDLLVHPDGRIAYYSISQSNMLLYRPNSESTHLRRLLSVDRDGLESPLIDDLRYFSTSSFSPNGRELALCIDLDVWVLDLERNSLNRFTFDRAYDYTPIWTPDGKWITFGSMRSGPANLYWKPSDGSGPAQRILENENDNYPCSWSPDGKVLAFLEISPDTGNDIWMYPTGDEQQPYPFINTPSSEMQAQFSPDGRWLAYTSNESGRPEVYVQPFPGPGGKWQVSKDGGFAPIWASDGSTIYFATPQESVMSTSVRSAPHFTVTKLQELFTLRGGTGFVAGRSFDISPDGQRFVFAQSQEPRETTQLNLIFDWVEAMRRRASAEN